MGSRSLLIVASNFPPVHSAGVYRTLRLAKYLPDLGWSIQVLTLDEGTLPGGAKTDTKLLDQVAKEIAVHRARARFPLETFNRWTGRGAVREKKDSAGDAQQTRQTANRNHQAPVGILQRMKDRITIPMMTPDRLVGWVRPASSLGISVARRQSFDLIYSSGPPWSNHLVARRIASKSKLPWVADFRDPWGGNAFRPDRSGDTWAGRKHRQLERQVYDNAQLIIFNTQRALDDAVGRVGSGIADRSVVIPNGFDPEHFSELVGKHEAPAGCARKPLTMIHAGSFYGRRNIDSLLKVISRLKRNGAIDRDGFQLKLIGAVRSREQQLVLDHGIEDIVSLLPAMPHSECLRLLAHADFLLLVQTDAPLCVPGKLYEYIALEKPVFTIASDGATADAVREGNMGPCVDPEDLYGIEAELMQSINHHEVDGRCGVDSTFRERFDGRQQMVDFNAAFERAIAVGHHMTITRGEDL